MSHHSTDPAENERIEKMMRDLKLGPTGDFPGGKLNATDEGGITVGITRDNGKVIIAFGKSVAWIGFTKTEALQIASLLMEHAKHV